MITSAPKTHRSIVQLFKLPNFPEVCNLTCLLYFTAPDGVRPPDLLSQTPTTITATWMPVGRVNAMDDPMFILQFRELTPGALVEE